MKTPTRRAGGGTAPWAVITGWAYDAGVRRGSLWQCGACGAKREGHAPEGRLCSCGTPMTDETGSADLVDFVSEPELGSPTMASALDLSLGGLMGATLGAVAVWASISLSPGATPFPELFGALPFIVPALYVLGGAGVGLALSARVKPMTRAASNRKRELATSAAAHYLEALRRTPLTPIAEARDGTRRIRGTVRVIEAPPGEQPDVAMSLVRGRRVGRFAVVDGTGEALVDDDMVEVFSELGGELTVRDGDRVEVVGSTWHRQKAPRAGAYRGGSSVELRGSAREKIVVLAVRAEPPAARARIEAAVDDAPEEHDALEEHDPLEAKRKVER